MDGKRLMASLAAAAILAAGIAFADGSGSEKARKAEESAGKTLFEAKCSVCHGLDRSLGKTKDSNGWTATVKRMQQNKGCQITDAEALEIIDHLVKIRGKGTPAS